jgi:nucleotide-binding universal stress UspA family protein
MYKTILVAVDNSDHSNQAVAQGLELGRRFEAKIVGCHVYPGRLHDYRFRQMEYTLPDQYLDETELHRQREIHDSLISVGLQLISDSYLDRMRRTCAERGIEFEPRMMDGKHHAEILREMRTGGYDLTVLGVLGLGRARDSQIGSVCERVARHAAIDVWVIKRLPRDEEDPRGTILVGIDGSPQSFGALSTALELAQRFGKRVEVVAVYDPYLHYSVFNGIVNVLTEKAAQVFRFEEQNRLHEEIIDGGLAQIYQSHLDVAEKIASDHGVDITKTLLDGKAFQKILNHARQTDPWLLVIGRLGVASPQDDPGLGSTSENLLRLCPCDLLLTTRLEYPDLDLKAEESLRWTPEATERMKRIPRQVRGIARTAIHRLAAEKGHSVITSDLLDEAMDRYMPKSTAARRLELARALALDMARQQRISVCEKCGGASAEPDPVKCSVCGGQSWYVITEEMLKKVAEAEGGLVEQTAYDGRKLRWSGEAKRALWTLSDADQRRRVKARVEKSARVKKLSTITLDHARKAIEEETGMPLELPARENTLAGEVPIPAECGEVKLIARDDGNNPLLSALVWTDDAVERILRVPVGFMRDAAQKRIEELARARGLDRIGPDLVEEGITAGRRVMDELARPREATDKASERDDPPAAASPRTGVSPEAHRRTAGSGTPPLNEAGGRAARISKRKSDPADDVD